MKTLSMWALIVLNVVLAMTLFARYGAENKALAQAPRIGDYLMVPGQVVGASNSTIYIVNMTTGELGALTFDPTRGKFDIMPPIDMTRLFDQAAGAAGRGAIPGGGGAMPRGR